MNQIWMIYLFVWKQNVLINFYCSVSDMYEIDSHEMNKKKKETKINTMQDPTEKECYFVVSSLSSWIL